MEFNNMMKPCTRKTENFCLHILHCGYPGDQNSILLLILAPPTDDTMLNEPATILELNIKYGEWNIKQQ